MALAYEKDARKASQINLQIGVLKLQLKEVENENRLG